MAIKLDKSEYYVFHFNPTLKENCVVRNSAFGKGWGEEERRGCMLFNEVEQSKIDFKIEEHKFVAQVNDKQFL